MNGRMLCATTGQRSQEGFRFHLLRQEKRFHPGNNAAGRRTDQKADNDRSEKSVFPGKIIELERMPESIQAKNHQADGKALHTQNGQGVFVIDKRTRFTGRNAAGASQSHLEKPITIAVPASPPAM